MVLRQAGAQKLDPALSRGLFISSSFQNSWVSPGRLFGKPRGMARFESAFAAVTVSCARGIVGGRDFFRGFCKKLLVKKFHS